MTGHGTGRAPRAGATLAAALAAALGLAACGGGGGGGGAPPAGPGTAPGLGDEALETLAADPAVRRLGDVLEGADALLFTGLHARYEASAAGEETRGTVAVKMACDGGRCTGEDGTAVDVGHLADPSGLGAVLTEAEPGARGGFDTLETAAALSVTESGVPGVTVTASPTVRSWGFWGAHGFAALETGAGRLEGTADGAALEGTLSLARAYALGAASGSNPSGTGGATWTGIAEASPKGTYRRLEGTATVTIADLSRPRVGVAIDVPGHDIGAPGWTDMAPAAGGFGSGTQGEDFLQGGFHGPGHEEAWGVFDTATHLGAFGASREP